MSDIIRVGPIDFKVEFVADLHSRSSNEDLLGRIDYVEEKIQVEKDTKDAMVGIIVWHEVLHAVSVQCGLKLDEDQVRSLAYQIVTLLLNNTELVCVESMREALVPTSECEV